MQICVPNLTGLIYDNFVSQLDKPKNDEEIHH